MGNRRVPGEYGNERRVMNRFLQVTLILRSIFISVFFHGVRCGEPRFAAVQARASAAVVCAQHAQFCGGVRRFRSARPVCARVSKAPHGAVCNGAGISGRGGTAGAGCWRRRGPLGALAAGDVQLQLYRRRGALLCQLCALRCGVFRPCGRYGAGAGHARPVRAGGRA